MPQSLALFLMILMAGAYSLRQALLVRKMFPGETLRGEVLQRLLYGAFAITAALVLNALGFLNAEVWKLENQSIDDAVRPDGSIAEPSLFGLMLAQLAIIGGTMALVITVWRTIRHSSAELRAFTKASLLGVASKALQSLLLPFWLAAIGVGSVFGISSGIGLREIVRNTELLVGPPLFLAVELTFVWFVTKIGLWRATPSGDIPPLLQFLFRKRGADDNAGHS